MSPADGSAAAFGARPAPRGVLFDFTGTLFWIESAYEAVVAALGPEFAAWAPELARVGAINGSGEAPDLPAQLAAAWDRRDLDPAAHRAAYSGLAEHAGLTADQARRLYDRGTDLAAWHAYPDTVEVLRRLHDASVPVGLLSNIGWDPRPVLAAHGVLERFAALVLSDERGVAKPDPGIFVLACAEIGVAPADVVMVGDNAVNDGAATSIGARFVLVDPDAHRAPDTLLRAVRLS